MNAMIFGAILLTAAFGARPASCTEAFASPPKSADAVIAIFRLLQPESRTSVLKENPKFSMKSCPKVKPDRWTRLLLLQEPVQYQTHFSPGCDLQGNTIVALSPFPVDVELRNFKGARRVSMTLQIQLTPQLSRGGLEVTFVATDGKLFPSHTKDKKKIASFTGEYHSLYHLNGKLIQPPSGFLLFGNEKTEFSLQ